MNSTHKAFGTHPFLANLQIPFLLNIANATSTYLPSFAFSPRATFQLLRKLDSAFSSLLNWTDNETGEQLPGFDSGRRVTVTEKVRIRGIVENTRTVVVSVFSKGGSVVESTDATEDEDEQMGDITGANEDIGIGSWEMEVAKVYEKTIVDIGNALDTHELAGFR